jgi:predicted small lipoprotein YifL
MSVSVYTGAISPIMERLKMHCWPRYLLWLVIAVLGTGSMLSACGQKGDLYLPDTKVEQSEEKSAEEKN